MGIVRLFRNRKEYRYTLPVHEQIRGSIEKNGGRIERSDLMIIHHGYSKKLVQGAVDRGERNLAILQEALNRSVDDPYLHYQTGVTLMSMGRKEEAYAEMKNVLLLDYAGMGSAILERLYMKLSQIALERKENNNAVTYARRCLDYNPANGIAMYVTAVGLLSMNKITDGYQMLLRIRENGGSNLRLDIQLEHLIKACKELLKV
jgi:tetratricopeptide (TPR) repeat protein